MYYRPAEGDDASAGADQVDDILTDEDIAEVNASLKQALAVKGDMPPHADRCTTVKTILLPYDRS